MMVFKGREKECLSFQFPRTRVELENIIVWIKTFIIPVCIHCERLEGKREKSESIFSLNLMLINSGRILYFLGSKLLLHRLGVPKLLLFFMIS